MIGIGALPRYQPRSRRTLPYTRKKRRSPKKLENRARIESSVNTEIVLFDHPAPLPVARLRSHSVSDLASRLHGARVDGWRWLRPRAVPATVAIVGMLAVLGAAEYLTRLARRTPIQTVAMPATQPQQVAEVAPPVIIVSRTDNQGTQILIDGNPAPAGTTLDVPVSSSGYQIRILPLHPEK
jgi:hypothetical protein